MARNQGDDVYDLIDFTKQHFGLDDVRANRFGKALAYRFAGEKVYISNRVRNSYRDTEIRNAFNGRNYKQLAKDYCLSERHIYNIVNSS